ncbi:MAG: hypothetical protein ACREPC_01720 [Stenotrophomonas sp.]|uniref:hypothetical protein n=1 Tax=Gammaproteobacteria TaxID=1236 RepID=UPI003D6D96D0
MSEQDSAETAADDYYTFRVRKRDVHLLAPFIALWVVWSERNGIQELFLNLMDALH